MGVTGEGGGTVARVVWGRERDIFQGLGYMIGMDMNGQAAGMLGEGETCMWQADRAC